MANAKVVKPVKKLKELETQVEVLKNQLAKALADYDNLKKRAAKDTEQLIYNRIKELSTELLLIVDSLDLAKQESAKVTQAWVDGTLSILDMIPSVVTKFGLTEINVSPGDKFNPSIHEALSTEKTDKYEKNTVTAVISRGYMLEGQLVRPARVIVAS